MDRPRFYRTVYEIEVLSDIPPAGVSSLRQIDYDITEGHASGVVSEKSCEEVPPERMAELLIAQGSDPEFLLGDEWEPEEDQQVIFDE